MIHLVLGDRGPRVSKVVENLARRPAANDLDAAWIDASETGLDEITVAVQTPPFFAAPRKVVLLNAPSAGKEATKFWKWLAAFVESPPDGLLLVVVFYMNGLTRSARRTFENRATKLKSEQVDVQILQELRRTGRDTSAYQWIREVVEAEGLRIDRGTANYLIERSTLDDGALEQEIKKIAALKNFTGQITENDIMEADPHPAERAIWEYLDAVIERRTGTALGILTTAVNNGEPPELVLAILGRTIPRLILIKALTAGRAPPRETASALRVPAWQARKLSGQASRFETRELRKMLTALVDLDFDYKSGRLPYGGLAAGLEALTVRFCYRRFAERPAARGV